MPGLKLQFFGTRGSIPVPGPTTMKYGGNTACIELRSEEDDWIIFDAGTGIRTLSDSLNLSKSHDIHIFISHPHWDHISGFPFFAPAFIPGNKITIYGPGTFEKTLEEIIRGQMTYSLFPVRTEELLADIKFRELKEETFELKNFRIETTMLNHPVTCLGYKIRYKENNFIYLGDNEPYYNVYNDDDSEVNHIAMDMNERLVQFIKGGHTLVTDSQYIPSEYESHKGWGHSTTRDSVNIAIKAGIKKLFFFHHDPLRSDKQLDFLVDHYRQKVKEKGIDLEIFAAMERQTYDI
jgi:phosphoribosyl 1,2-cyclic phosphodiesterase